MGHTITTRVKGTIDPSRAGAGLFCRRRAAARPGEPPSSAMAGGPSLPDCRRDLRGRARDCLLSSSLRPMPSGRARISSCAGAVRFRGGPRPARAWAPQPLVRSHADQPPRSKAPPGPRLGPWADQEMCRDPALAVDRDLAATPELVSAGQTASRLIRHLGSNRAAAEPRLRVLPIPPFDPLVPS